MTVSICKYPAQDESETSVAVSKKCKKYRDLNFNSRIQIRDY